MNGYIYLSIMRGFADEDRIVKLLINLLICFNFMQKKKHLTQF